MRLFVSNKNRKHNYKYTEGLKILTTVKEKRKRSNRDDVEFKFQNV